MRGGFTLSRPFAFQSPSATRAPRHEPLLVRAVPGRGQFRRRILGRVCLSQRPQSPVDRCELGFGFLERGFEIAAQKGTSSPVGSSRSAMTLRCQEYDRVKTRSRNFVRSSGVGSDGTVCVSAAAAVLMQAIL